MSDIYTHKGWIGEPYASDFDSKWGIIAATDIMDARNTKSIGEAAKATLAANKTYFIAPKESKLGNRLYHTSPGGSAHCVYAMLGYLEKGAAVNKENYHSKLRDRVRTLLSVARRRASSFDLTVDQMLPRFEQGLCEATGIPFEMTGARNPFSPSLDQKVPGAGYTIENVQVVCLIYNQMKSDFSDHDVQRFIDQLKATN